MNRKKLAWYVGYISELMLALFFCILSFDMLRRIDIGWVIIGFCLAVFGFTYLQSTVKKLIEGYSNDLSK